VKRLFLDFEFNKSQEPNNNPICVSYTAIWEDQQEWGNYWLLDPEEREEFIEVIKEYIEDDFTFVAFYAAAEARSLISLGVKVTNIKWVCLWVEYHMLLNHNHRFSTGKHLIEGKEKILYVPKPKWERTDDDPASQKAETSLVACTCKLCGVNISQENKDAMRDLILENDSWTEEEQAKIMHYCQSDITYLPKILEKIYAFYRKAYSKHDQTNLNQEILLRGKYAALTAEMESSGYPINVTHTRNFSNSVKQIIFEMQKEINDKFEWGPFLIDKKGEKFTQKEKPIREWIARQKHETWLKTDKGAASLSLEAFEKHYSSRGDINVFGNAFTKYLRNKQSLNGFMPKKKGKTLYDSLGSDGRVRPYFGIFRAQSSRSQPSATGYILLKSSWMRCLIEPPRGRTIIAIDYSQQEFLIAGLLSRCEAMLKAYESGDVYLYTGKLAGAIPWKGTKKEYPELRDQFKSTCVAKGTLIYTDSGLKKIEDITSNDLIWDGTAWRSSQGAKYMGRKDVIKVGSCWVTSDHRVLTQEGWKNAESCSRGEWKIQMQRNYRLQGYSVSWTDVWKMARYLGGSCFKGKPSKALYTMRRWLQRGTSLLRKSH